MPSTPKFTATQQRQFSSELQKNVRQYFRNRGIGQHANALMIFRTITFLSLWVGSYLVLLLVPLSLPAFFGMWLLLGLAMPLVTLNIGHDAIHGAYSKHKWVNQLLSHTFNFNGASAYMWRRMHNTAHHTYTNVYGHDEDIEPGGDVIRLCEHAKRAPVHGKQHIYAFFLYSLATISWVFIKDYVKFFSSDVGNYSGEKHTASATFFLFFYKVINYSIYIVLPLVFIPVAWYYVVAGFVLMHLISGFLLAMIFMLAHTVEETHFPQPDENNRFQTSWAVHQLYTTVNFTRNAPWLTYFIGGLDHQVEHHLFPNICSAHYPAIAKIVESTAKKYGIPYYNLTPRQAVASHFNYLKKMGQKPKPAAAAAAA